MPMTNLDYIAAYADRACLDKDDIVEILYSICADCPISINMTDNLPIMFEFPNGELVTLFSFEPYPASLVLHVGDIQRRFDDYGYFPFELDELSDCCALYSTISNPEYMYLDIKSVIENLHDIVDAVRKFCKTIYLNK